MRRFVSYLALSATICFSIPSSLPAAEQEIAAHPLPTPRQWKIFAALDEATELDMADQPLSDVIEYWKQKHEIEIQLDGKALADAGIGSDTPVTLKTEGIRLRSALRMVLGNLDLTYSVGDGYLLITSKTEAENKLTSKIYPVHDLVTLDSMFRPRLEPGEKAGPDFQSLIELITSTVAPTTWDEVGGPGGIKAFTPSRALAISQTEEAHENIASLLADLRRTRDKQLAAAGPVDVVERQKREEGPLEIKVYRLVRQTEESKAAAESSAEKAAQHAGQGAAEASRGGNLEAWAKAIAELVPEMIEPESWASGKAMIRAVGETVVVRQTDDAQNRIGKLIMELAPGSTVAPVRTYYSAVRLSHSSVHAGWPHQAEPLPRNIEAQINEALGKPCELDFADQPLSDVIESLGNQCHVQIHLDNKALSDAGVGSDTPITRTMKGLSLRTALRLVLDELDLSYIIRNEVLLITSKTEAENMLTTKVYPVFDLAVRPPDAPATRPGLDFEPLVENITSNIGPSTWDEVGGPGAIMPFTNSGALVISQTTEIHEEIAQFLQALREVGAVQPK
ncbi:MAG TPA: hypothetical protein VG826_05810 [Pirellulales bacterium]|nr:hypothetical protein [Pirellulales bacterium]